ncbi:DUF1559 domain-containing protein [Chlamydiota bacterium]
MYKKSGLTIMELVIVLVITILLSMIILPVLKTMRKSGDKATCVNNLKQIGIAFSVYRSDYNGFIPASYWWNSAGSEEDTWDNILLSYIDKDPTLSTPRIYLCPTYIKQHPDFKAASPPHISDIKRTYGMNNTTCPGFNINTEPEKWPHIDKIVVPSSTILIAPVTRTNYNGTFLEEPVADPTRNVDFIRHKKGAQYLFFDGHVEWMSENDHGEWENN